jgi:hypothetical protein
VLHESCGRSGAEDLHDSVLVKLDGPRADVENRGNLFIDLPSASSCSTSRSRTLNSRPADLPFAAFVACSSISLAMAGET